MSVKRISLSKHESRPQLAMMLSDLTGCDRRGSQSTMASTWANKRTHHGAYEAGGKMWQRWECRALERARTLGGPPLYPRPPAFCVAACEMG